MPNNVILCAFRDMNFGEKGLRVLRCWSTLSLTPRAADLDVNTAFFLSNEKFASCACEGPYVFKSPLRTPTNSLQHDQNGERVSTRTGTSEGLKREGGCFGSYSGHNWMGWKRGVSLTTVEERRRAVLRMTCHCRSIFVGSWISFPSLA